MTDNLLPFIPFNGNLVKTRMIHGGIQYLWKFANNYQVSLVNHIFSYGWEFAVMKDDKIVYDTPVTSDVIGHIDVEEDLEGLLQQVKDL